MAKKIIQSDEVKRFIVQKLAEHEHPSDVAEMVKETFGINITRQGVHCYDPTHKAGKDLRKDLKEMFIKARAEWLERVTERWRNY